MIKEIHSRYSCGDNFSEAGRLQKLFQLSVYVPAAIHNAHDFDCFLLMIRYVEYQIIVHRHDAEVTAEPRFFFIGAEPFRHLIQRGNTLFQPVKLTCSILNRLQVKGNVFKMPRRSFSASVVNLTS